MFPNNYVEDILTLTVDRNPNAPFCRQQNIDLALDVDSQINTIVDSVQALDADGVSCLLMLLETIHSDIAKIILVILISLFL